MKLLTLILRGGNMLLDRGNSKHFRSFKKDYELEDATCFYCGQDFDQVDLTMSNRETLNVKCKTKDCNGYTIANRIK